MSNITHKLNTATRVIRRYELTGTEWERLTAYFSDRQMSDKGRARREPREMLNSIL